jgi:DNA-binding MarR family transcriptional regulator
MKIKQETRDTFLSALQKLVYAIKIHADECGELCGGINEKELLIIDYVGQNKYVKMSNVAEILDVPLSTLTTIVDKLVERNYLSREHRDDDRRVINVMLGVNGKTAYEVLRSKKKRVAEKLLSQFSEKDQTAFIEQMNILASILGER